MDMDVEYLSEEQLKGFDNYKYSSLDTSPISIYVMHPFWNKIVQFVPRWVAPNALTFAGFLLTVANLLVVCWLDYGFTASSLPPPKPHITSIPDSCWIFMGVSLFVAYTLDGIDGKQARRTGTSGPLGELFDHGLDSLAASLVPICLYSCFGRYDYSVSPWRMYFVIWNILISFYLTHWEKYITGILFLPWGYDFGMLSSTFVFLGTGLFGYTMWKVDMPLGLTSGIMFEVMIYTTSLFCNLPVTLINIKKSYKNNTAKQHGFCEATRPLWPLIEILVLVTMWVGCSPSNIIDRDPRTVFILVGTLFSNVSCRLIVSQMSSTRCEAFNILMLPVMFAMFLSYLIPLLELLLLYLVTLVCLAAHIHYGTCVVQQMCRHFNVDCFRIKNCKEQ